MARHEKFRNTATDTRGRIEKNMVGTSINVDARVLIPVVKLQYFSDGKRFQGEDRGFQAVGVNITPMAFVVVDPKETRVLSLQERDLSLNELTDSVPGLTRRIKEERAAHENTDSEVFINPQ